MQITQEIKKFKIQNPKLRKLGENLERLHTLILIRNEGFKTFGNHKDLAKIPVESF
jgi:hypothetical protein